MLKSVLQRKGKKITREIVSLDYLHSEALKGLQISLKSILYTPYSLAS